VDEVYKLYCKACRTSQVFSPQDRLCFEYKTSVGERVGDGSNGLEQRVLIGNSTIIVLTL
jgi:hypothetical protein